MSTIILKEIKEWTEKKQRKEHEGALRIYVGSLHVANLYPDADDNELYVGLTMLDGVNFLFPKKGSLGEMKDCIELGMKEFAKKFIKSFK